MYDKQLVDVSFWIFFQPIFLDNKKNNIICSFEMVSSQRSRIIVLESSRIERIYFFIEFTNKRSFSLRHYYHYTDSIIWISIMSILCGDRHFYLFVVHWKGYCNFHECVEVLLTWFVGFKDDESGEKWSIDSQHNSMDDDND